MSSGPFVPVNAQAIAPTLLESELFGHVKDAFPDALSDRPGLFQQAHHGTLFLNEVAEIPLELQAKILRALTEGEVYRVGSQTAEPIDVRVIAATRFDIEELVERGRFNRDLFYRLNVVDLVIPPLRERGKDVRLLANEFLKRYGVARERLELSAEALWTIEQHDWPGNVRELENCIERACAMAKGETIEITDLPQPLQDLRETLVDDKIIPPLPASDARRGEVERRSVAGGVPAKTAPSKPWEQQISEEDEPVSLRFYEKLALMRALKETNGDKLAAAKLLGIGKSTFYRKLAAHNI
jgi:two-component system response regulator HydG